MWRITANTCPSALLCKKLSPNIFKTLEKLARYDLHCASAHTNSVKCNLPKARYGTALGYRNLIFVPQRRFCVFMKQSGIDYVFSKSSQRNKTSIRWISTRFKKKQIASGMMYVCATGIFMFGLSYAGVPLYKMFCQATGIGGQAVRGHDTSKVEVMTPIREREITIRFNADRSSRMQWNFKPQQYEIKLVPGETALAFYTAKNPTDKPVIGIATYNVLPFEAGLYFNKIQCFCFEEQMLNPHEEVDMPVFFYIDPEFDDDPKLQNCDQITLSYTFFEAKDGMELPLPGFMQAQ